MPLRCYLWSFGMCVLEKIAGLSAPQKACPRDFRMRQASTSLQLHLFLGKIVEKVLAWQLQRAFERPRFFLNKKDPIKSDVFFSLHAGELLSVQLIIFGMWQILIFSSHILLFYPINLMPHFITPFMILFHLVTYSFFASRTVFERYFSSLFLSLFFFPYLDAGRASEDE